MSISSIECTYISDDFLHQLKNGDPNLKLANPVPVLRFLYELVWSMVHATLPFQKCKAALDAVEFSVAVSEEELGSYFADIVTQMALDLTMSGELRARPIKLASWLVEYSLFPVRFFQERCEEEFLACRTEYQMLSFIAQVVSSHSLQDRI